MPSIAPIVRLVGIYDADGSLVGEVRYVVGHLFGRAECALCDITHGALWRKRAFDDLRGRLEVPLVLLHRDEVDEELRSLTEGRLPCVVAEHADQRRAIVLDRDDLRRCEGDVTVFETTLRGALDAC